ncbi:MAG: hypothetical protein Q9214_002612 [Letrouitia sp. 1 TL-2023]
MSPLTLAHHLLPFQSRQLRSSRASTTLDVSSSSSPSSSNSHPPECWFEEPSLTESSCLRALAQMRHTPVFGRPRTWRYTEHDPSPLITWRDTTGSAGRGGGREACIIGIYPENPTAVAEDLFSVQEVWIEATGAIRKCVRGEGRAGSARLGRKGLFFVAVHSGEKPITVEAISSLVNGTVLENVL